MHLINCKGDWEVAQSSILGMTMILARLRRKGYESMLAYYLNAQPQIHRTSKYKNLTLGGV